MANYIIVCFGESPRRHLDHHLLHRSHHTTNTNYHLHQSYSVPDDHYKQRFTEALKQEADFIRRLVATKRAFVYIFENEMAAADVTNNLQDGVRHMGAYQAWEQFVMMQVCPLSVLVESMEAC